MKAPFWLAPVLWAVFPPLFCTANNFRLLSQGPLVFLVFLPTLAAFLLAFGVSFLLKRRGQGEEKPLIEAKAGVLASFSILAFFSYVLVRVLLWWLVGAPFRFEGLFGLLVWGAVFLLVAGAIVRSRRDLSNALTCLTVMAACVVVINVGLIAGSVLRTRDVSASRPSRHPLPDAGTSHEPPRRPPPDVYYIILDRYPDAATLREHFALDNTPFLEHLTHQGFYVAAESRSNYLKTALSLASSLNMEYLNSWAQKIGPRQSEWTYLDPLLEDYRVWRFLRERGYRFVHVGSDFNPIRYNRYADENVNYFSPPECYWELASLTPLEALGSEANIGYFNHNRMRHQRTRREFQRLAAMAREPGPKFVFAHLMVPHPPYIFDRDGAYLQAWVTAPRSREENFRNQLLFVNQQLEATLDRILAESTVPPVIIIQGDEGPYPIRYEMDEYDFDWRSASSDELREKTGILNAYYLPGVPKDSLTPTLSPVNSFRLVFNLYFGSRFPLLPDETYAHTSDRRPYDFFSVTARLRQRDGHPEEGPDPVGRLPEPHEQDAPP